MAESRTSLHFGGPLGVLGLGCVAGAVALAVAALNNAPAGTAEASDPVLTVDTPVSPAVADRPVATASEHVREIAQVQQAETGLPQARPARESGTEVHFIVRLKGAPEVDVITANFKRNPPAAEAAWQDLVNRVPELAAFTLVGASYSGEIKLAYQMPASTAAAREDIRAVQDRLLTIEGVAYADPDYIAHPGKD